MTKFLGYYWSPAVEDLQEQIDLLVYTGANAVFIPHRLFTKQLLDRLHDQGIRVLVDRGIFAGEAIRQQFPDSVPVDAAGLPFERDEWYMPACPNHPQLRRHHLDALADLLDQQGHEIDGLWLDFIRFPVRWEGSKPNIYDVCFCQNCLNAFLGEERNAYSHAETETIAQSILHERQAEWVEWKCARIANFVQEIKTQITARTLALPLGAFILPWRRADFDGAIRRVAGQDLAMLAQHIDVFTPMVYHKLCYQPPQWIESVISDHAAWSHKPTLPIIQSVHAPGTMTAAQMDAALANALSASSEGTMIFRFEPLLTSNELASVVRQHFTSARP